MSEGNEKQHSVLDQLKQWSVIVADTGELDAIEKFKPQDATTNPSLLLKVAIDDRYKNLLEDAIKAVPATAEDRVTRICDAFAVTVGAKISQLIPGRISTEVPAHFSFDTQATVNCAKGLIEQYEALGVPSDRVLIKIAGTWEGIAAAKILEKSGIQCNVTLVFSLEQAVASAEAGAFLISPFVGRIYDWYKANKSFNDPDPNNDPGVQSVRRIYQYFRAKDFPTIVMGASFRTTGQIIALSGCDRLTIAPSLLEELLSNNESIERVLNPDSVASVEEIDAREPAFRWQLNGDEMAHFKLAEGIRRFDEDYQKLQKRIADSL